MISELGKLRMVVYTDPLCCWSWALLPGLQRLKKEFAEQLTISYCMGGMIPNWDEFKDPMNSISKPSQMGPLWMDAGLKTGASCHDRVWLDDPPNSSYPACIAVKTAQLQSENAGEAYLEAVMEAVMVQGKNIAKEEILLAIATKLAADHKLDSQQFFEDFNGPASREAFRNDLQQLRFNKIGRFPTITITKEDGEGLLFTGYRPYEVLLLALSNFIPALQPNQQV